LSAPAPTKVLIADDEWHARTALRVMIGGQSDLRVVGEAENGAEVVREAARLNPDVVLMDVRMPRMDGIEATRRLVDRCPDRPRVLVISTFENDEYVYEALRAGASGFVLKRAGPSEIVRNIRTAASGESLVIPAPTRRIIERFGPERTADPRAAAAIADLTNREREVLRLVAAGRTNDEIAEELSIARQTVKTHVSSVLRQLQVNDRTQAAVLAHEAGFVYRDGVDPGTG
jgi:DNA-binding NarL/FixJ family response regulator